MVVKSRSAGRSKKTERLLKKSTFLGETLPEKEAVRNLRQQPVKFITDQRLAVVNGVFRKIFRRHGGVELTTPELFCKNPFVSFDLNRHQLSEEATLLGKDGAVFGLR